MTDKASAAREQGSAASVDLRRVAEEWLAHEGWRYSC